MAPTCKLQATEDCMTPAKAGPSSFLEFMDCFALVRALFS